MEKKSICKSISAGKPYPNKYGKQGEVLYPWNIIWENGDTGQQSTKKNEPPYVVGQEYPYELVVGTWEDGKEKISFKKIDLNKNFKRKDPTIALKAYACKYATRFVTGEIIPAPKEGDNQAWMKFVDGVTKSAKSFYKEMMHDVSVYGSDNSDVIGTAMSQAIDCVLEGKIQKDRIYLYYRILLEAVLQKQQPQQ